MSLFIGLYAQYNGTMLYDFSSKAENVTFTTNEHGFGDCSFFIPLTLAESFALYDRVGLQHVLVSDGAATVWEGRLEDVAIVNGGINLRAFGYWRALSDMDQTAFYSIKSISAFSPILETVANRAPQLYAMNNGDNDGGVTRLFVGLVKGNVYATGTDVGGYHYQTPAGSNTKIAYVSFDYKYNLPTDWVARASSWDAGFTSEQVSDLTTTGGTNAAWPNTNSATWTLAASRTMLGFEIFNGSGSPYTMAGETGSFKLHVTNIRITYAAPPIYASTIVADLAALVNYGNSAQLSSSTLLVESPGTDLTDQVFEAITPADILTSLAALGDSATPPNVFEAGVWEGQVLHFRQRGKYGRAWYVDASALEIERTIDTLYNRVIASYTGDSGINKRTAHADNNASMLRYSLVRQHILNVDTSDITQAGVYRDASLQDTKDPAPRVAVTFDKLYDASGGLWPMWYCRSGDTITIRNLPPTVSADVDRIRTFRVSETSYEANTNILSVTPELPQNRVEVLLARKEAGL
jgi:hypothetical protein